MIRVATRARSIDELVAKLAPFADDDGVLLPATGDVLTGGEDRLALELADKRVVLSGRVRIETGGGSTGASSFVRVTFRELDAEGRRVHERLLARRRLDATRGRLPTPGGTRSEESVMMVLPTARATPDPGGLQALVERVSIEPGADLEAQNPTRKISLAPRPSPFAERPGPELGNDDETVVAISSEDVVPEGAGTRRPSAPPPPPAMPLPAPMLPPTTSTAELPRLAPPRKTPPPDEPTEGTRRSGVARQPDVVERLGVIATSDATRSRVRRAAPWVIAGIAGFAVGRLSAPSPRPAPPIVAQAPAVPEPVVPSPAAPPAVVPPVERSAPKPAPPTGGCTTTVRTEPAGVTVQWGDKTLGETPLVDVAVPCGRALVSLRRPRYQQVVRNVAAAPGEPVTLQERLTRPEAQLVVTTKPAGAHLIVNGQDRGRAPQEVTVSRYETARVQAKLEGHRVASKKVYVDRATERLELTLAGGKK